MNRVFFLFLVFCFLFIVPSPLSASYVTINPNGNITVNVLSDQDENTGNHLQVTKLAENIVGATPQVKLTKEDGSVQMLVTNKDGTKELHVPKKTDTLIEIEERPETQKLAIGLIGNQFFLKQKEYTALTNYPLTVDSQSAHLVANKDSGDTLLTVLPLEAVESILRSGIVSKITNNSMEIIEEDHTLQYKITGEKVFSLLNIYNYTVPVDAYVSVSDGSIVKIDSSTWYRFMNLLVG